MICGGQRYRRSRWKPPAADGVGIDGVPPEPLTRRSWLWVLSRPSVWVHLMLAGFFLLERGPMFLVLMFGAFAGVRIMSLLSNPEVEERVRLREEKSERGLGGAKLDERERQLLLRVDTYRRRLIRAGGDPTLADRVMDGAWDLVRKRRGGTGSARKALKNYFNELPPIEPELERDDEEGADEDLRAKLEAELHILRATHRELNV